MSNPQQPPFPADGQAGQGWYDPAGPQSGAYPVQPYQQPTQPYAPPPYAQPHPPQQPYAQPYPPPPYVQPVMPQQNVQVNVIAGRRGVNHGLHLVLTILTCGLWAIVWIIVAISNS
ncbi:hypothetical protein ACFYOT_01565 [Saccharothrix saharensis]|uniref:hypothetical protein n=1 Tax=Saccharothrix saharensis TaxID=571190 RepID=UPI0036A7970D